VVVDLAVEDDSAAVVLVSHRLPAERREVDDREPVVTERGPVVELEPLPVGPAVGERLDHALQARAICVGIEPRGRDKTGDPAHSAVRPPPSPQHRRRSVARSRVARRALGIRAGACCAIRCLR